MKKIKAFSLIELLISLIVISVIIASFAPVMTKRLSKTSITLGSGDSAITNECSSFGANCKLCNKDKCLFCDVNCLSNQYKDAINCKCVDCASNCTSCDASGCTLCKAGHKKDGANCTQCEIGQYSTGNNICATCEGGKYSSAKGSSSCQTCEAGYKCENGIKTQCTGNLYQDVSAQNSCKTCSTGIVTTDRKTCKTCAQAFGAECTACSTTKCTACSVNFEVSGTGCARSGCPDGTYLSGGTCPACSAFHLKCTKCNATEGCTECAAGYIPVNGKCNKKVTQADCTSKFDGFWDGFNSICVTKRNMGYSANGSSTEKYKEIPIPTEAGVSSVKVTTKCPATKCCWFGTTGDTGVNTAANSSDLTAKNGTVAVSPAYTYSSYKRTICNWEAANSICPTYNGGSAAGYWRLPTKKEFDVWSSNITSIATGLGQNGLQLCDMDASNKGSPRCNWMDNKCNYSSSNHICAASIVWSGSMDNNKPCIAKLEGGSLTVNYIIHENILNAYSVRCVIDNYPSD